MLHRHILAHEPKDPPTNNPHISDQPFLPKTASDSVQRTKGTSPSPETFLDQKPSDHKRTGYLWEGPNVEIVDPGEELLRKDMYKSPVLQTAVPFLGARTLYDLAGLSESSLRERGCNDSDIGEAVRLLGGAGLELARNIPSEVPTDISVVVSIAA